MRILVVEDEQYSRKALVRLLERFDPAFLIDEARDGDEANAMLEANHYDLSICDIRIPVVDGLSVSRRALEQGFVDHVVLLTGFAEFNYALEALHIGVRDYLLKPVDTDKLYGILESILDLHYPKYNDTVVDTLNTYIQRNLASKINIADFCRTHLFMHPAYVSRYYKKVTGETIMATLQKLRMERAFHLLTKTKLSVTDVGERCGYSDASIFINTFRKAYGKTPLELRSQHKGRPDA